MFLFELENVFTLDWPKIGALQSTANFPSGVEYTDPKKLVDISSSSSANSLSQSTYPFRLKYALLAARSNDSGSKSGFPDVLSEENSGVLVFHDSLTPLS